VRTDLGGIYFNLVFALGLFGVYYATRFEPLLVVVAIEHALVFNQFWPWLRLDGYYVLNDLTGVPDVMSHVKPLLRSLVPGRTPCPRVAELKPRVRWILTIYAVALVPMLALMLALLAWATPHIVGTAWRVLHVEYRVFVHEAARADAGGATVAAARALLLALPACGILLGLSRMLLRLLDAAARRLGVTAPLRPKLGALLRPAVVFIAGFAAAGALASAWHESRTGVRTAAGAQLRDSRGRHTTRNNVRPAAASARISSAPRRPTWSTNATTAGVAASAPRPRGTTTARRAAVPKPPGTTSTTGSTSTTGTTGTTTTDTTSTTDTTTTDTTSTTGTTPTTTTTTTPTTTTGG
jgi:putative peptide zinc metalloprotease protein